MKTAEDKKLGNMWLKSYKILGVQRFTKSYQTWNAMNTRCKLGGSRQKLNPTYIGCKVEGIFQDFQEFTKWYTTQVGYREVNYHLDKDLLVRGNMIYSDVNCCLIPRELNGFLLDSKKARGAYPQGVSFHKATGKLRATISIDGKAKHLGLYLQVQEAYNAYTEAKDAEAQRWYQRLLEGEYLVDERVIERMRNWSVYNTI